MQEVRVYLIPRRVQRAGKVTTALREAMSEQGLGVWRLEAATREGGQEGVSHGTIHKLSHGTGGVEHRKAEAIAKALGKPVGSLFMSGAELIGAGS